MDRRHDQHIGGIGDAGEGIERQLVLIQRHVHRHFAVIFEIDAAAFQDMHRLDDALAAFAA